MWTKLKKNRKKNFAGKQAKCIPAQKWKMNLFKVNSAGRILPLIHTEHSFES